MTKTITKEQLEEWVSQLGSDGGCDATDRQLEALIRQSLAAMDSEPVYQYQSGVYNDDNGETDWYWDDCDKGFYEQYAHDRRRILYRHAQPAPELAAIVERLNLSGYEYEGGEVTPQNAAAIVDTLLQQLDDAVQGRNAQPASVVPPMQHWEELCRQYPDMSIRDAIIRAAWWNHCRAAMLNGGKP